MRFLRGFGERDSSITLRYLGYGCSMTTRTGGKRKNGELRFSRDCSRTALSCTAVEQEQLRSVHDRATGGAKYRTGVDESLGQGRRNLWDWHDWRHSLFGQDWHHWGPAQLEIGNWWLSLAPKDM